MRQIISLVHNGTARYATYDDATGELTQFAQLAVPDSFDLEAAATVGTNLAAALGLDRNGSRARAKEVAHTFVEQVVRPQLPGVDAPPKKKRKGGRPKGGSLPGRYYISLDMIREVLREHDPDKQGMTPARIADHIATKPEDRDWVVKGISNRQTTERAKVAKGGSSPLAWRVEPDGKLNRLYLIWNGP